ncbi:hypothetical protein Hypma_007945 [Hypsizygus marmoreus]|uniref:Uncharacterized protein n=1 Tax=Hypsizygus marmoreus TaxID=39966 RepID=A0A369JTR3_HYPMA|nr:hypothetical protein Hypma_007945 [Hypsizygus marmoreus]
MGAKFLCCLPLRLGVLVISFIQFVVTGAVAGFLWWILYYADSHNRMSALRMQLLNPILSFLIQVSELTSKMKASLLVAGIVYTAVAIISLTGFVGALMKRLGGIKAYLWVLGAALGFQIGTAVFTLISYYRYRGSSGKDCNVKDANLGTIDICEAYARVPQGAMIASVIVPILVQAYACYVVTAYGNRLIQKKAQHSSMAMNSNPPYTSVAPTEETYPLSQPNVIYPYSDSANSFGVKGQPHDGSNHV